MNEQTTTTTVDSMVDNQTLRQKYIDRVEVLDKVKELFLIPQIEMMTARQIANFYEVEQKVIEKCFERNRSEIEADGCAKVKPSYFSEFFDSDIMSETNYERVRGGIKITLSDNVAIMIPNCGSIMFSKRAVLRFGMLLRDSEIAKEVRTQLLNITEHTAEENPEILTTDIDKELELLQNAVGVAFCTGDMMKFAEATMKLNAFKDRHNAQLKAENVKLHKDNKELAEKNDVLIGDNAILSGNILAWSDRASVNKVVRLMAQKLNWQYSYCWNQIYDELKYKHGINLKQRWAIAKKKSAPYLAYLHDDEWECLYITIAAMLHARYVNPSEIFRKAKVDGIE